MNLRNRHRDETEVHTGPLNDILFILLLFFLIVSTLANPNVVKLTQPKSKSDTKAKQTVVVSILRRRRISLPSSSMRTSRCRSTTSWR
jgi:biopolymer transport protein ExbD